MLSSVLLLTVGLVILYYGAEFLVEGSSRIALALGISPLIVGLTVVAFGTSAPEFVVSLLSALDGQPAIAVGNVVGSNLANIALIVGCAAVIMPMAVDRQLLTRDYPAVLLLSALLLGAVYLGPGPGISRIESLVLLAVFAGYLGLCIRAALVQRRAFQATQEYLAVGAASNPDLAVASEIAVEAAEQKGGGLAVNLTKTVGGIVGLVIGARMMVSAAVDIASHFGVSELVIGMTVVAVGTSLPELATSVVAALRKEAELSLGNIVGSNIFNVGFVLGLVGIIRPIDVAPEALRFDFPAMMLVTVLFFPILIYNRKVSRLDAVVLLAMYFTFIGLTFVRAANAG